MSSQLPPTVPGIVPALVRHELARLRKEWWWFLLLGILLTVGGVFAVSYPCVTSEAAIVVLGTVLVIGGVATIVASFWTGRWSAFLLQVLVGILYVVTGIVMTDVPAEAVAILTLFVAASFVVSGIFRIVAALTEKFPQWGWVLLNGLVTMMIGIMIIKTFPQSAVWVIGLLIGLEMIFNGWTWIMLSLAIRNLPEEQPTTSHA